MEVHSLRSPNLEHAHDRACMCIDEHSIRSRPLCAMGGNLCNPLQEWELANPGTTYKDSLIAGSLQLPDTAQQARKISKVREPRLRPRPLHICCRRARMTAASSF